MMYTGRIWMLLIDLQAEVRRFCCPIFHCFAHFLNFSSIIITFLSFISYPLIILTGTVSRDNKQTKLHVTYSRAYALWGPVPVPLSYFKPFRSFQCLHIYQKKFKTDTVHKSLVIILNDIVCRPQPR